MGVIVIVAYKPKPGGEEKLLELTRKHVDTLRAEGLATERTALAMRAQDGTVIEVFEWVSAEAIGQAHSNAAVLEMWKEYEAACDYTPLINVPESQQLFAGFEPIDL